ncbi:AEC family transporter [Litorilinea aerophila]|uniref:AEC family transporter n=1 Tax=Litorilinea aerophila TaxID=1204385 RepID=A0A540VKK7_9CHLR|nr:AEC family transporter [Litorilinea aerophila]MCC9075886.1 AEC family transporter [Litorilinea aerophila]
MFIIDTLLPIFVSTVLPVFLVAGAGFALSSWMSIDSRSLGRILFYLATPSLVFRSLYQMDIDFVVLQHLALVAGTVTLSAGFLGWLFSAGQERRQRAAMTLTSAVSNNGNMGIPICFFAFGQAGLALGSIYYVVSSFLSNTVGVVVASAGQTPVRDALKVSLRVPVLYAAALGLLLNWTGTEIPLSLFRALDLLANAAIPGMLVLLGIQLRSVPLLQGQAVILRSVAVRLLAAPVVAWQLCAWLGITGVERNVLILQAAMPTAVMAAVLATEYEAAPQLVAAVIFLSTAVSMVTLSVVLWLLH